MRIRMYFAAAALGATTAATAAPPPATLNWQAVTDSNRCGFVIASKSGNRVGGLGTYGTNILIVTDPNARTAKVATLNPYTPMLATVAIASVGCGADGKIDLGPKMVMSDFSNIALVGYISKNNQPVIKVQDPNNPASGYISREAETGLFGTNPNLLNTCGSITDAELLARQNAAAIGGTLVDSPACDRAETPAIEADKIKAMVLNKQYTLLPNP